MLAKAIAPMGRHTTPAQGLAALAIARVTRLRSIAPLRHRIFKRIDQNGSLVQIRAHSSRVTIMATASARLRLPEHPIAIATKVIPETQRAVATKIVQSDDEQLAAV